MALSMDHCSGRAYFVAAAIEGRSGKEGVSWSHLQLAHKLSPNDDDVMRARLWAMPSLDCFAELEHYAAPRRISSLRTGRLPKTKLAGLEGAPCFAGVQGHRLPVKHWETANYDPFAKAHGTDLAGTLSYRVLGALRKTVDTATALRNSRRRTRKRYAGF